MVNCANTLLSNEVNGGGGSDGLLPHSESSYKRLKTVESLEFVIRNSSIFMIFAYSFIFKKGLSTVGVHMTWRIFIIYHAAVDAKLNISFEMCFCIRLQYVTFISLDIVISFCN